MLKKKHMDISFESHNAIELRNRSFHRLFLNCQKIDNCDVLQCDFRNATMSQIYVKNTIVKESILVMLEVMDSQMIYCDFKEQYIAFSTFRNVDFSNTDFTNVCMNKNIFYNCNFCGANMSCREIVDCKFENSICDNNTYWGEKYNTDMLGIKVV